MKKTLVRHVVTTPETVQSLVIQGVFSTGLPEYVSPRVIRLFDVESQPAFTSHTSSEQTFIVEIVLEFDANDPITEIHEQSQYIHMSKIDHNKVARVYACSEKGKKLLISLLGSQYSKLAKIDASKFNKHAKDEVNVLNGGSNLEDAKRGRQDPKKEEVGVQGSYTGILKKLKSSQDMAEEVVTPSSPAIKQHLDLFRLSSTEEHKAFLDSAFKRAKKSILMTSYSLDSETFKILNLYKLIMSVRQRGVTVYIYYSDQKNIDQEVFRFLCDYQVKLDQTLTHSKLFIVDDQIVSIGSFNWLSGVTDRYPVACDGTIVIQDHPQCFDLKEDLWMHIKRYRNIQFENEREIERFETDMANFDSIEYPIDSNSMMVYLPTLDQQRGYLVHSLDTAKKSIIICSPFISASGEFIKDFDLETLSGLSKREVQVIFVCDANNQNIAEFRDFLNKLDSPFVHLVLATNFHLKTIIVDDKEISEGSFNWLSAVRYEGSQYHNHEAVIVIEGNKALALIQHFHNSPIGQAIENYFKKPSSNNDQVEEESSTSYCSF